MHCCRRRWNRRSAPARELPRRPAISPTCSVVASSFDDLSVAVDAHGVDAELLLTVGKSAGVHEDDTVGADIRGGQGVTDLPGPAQRTFYIGAQRVPALDRRLRRVAGHHRDAG